MKEIPMKEIPSVEGILLLRESLYEGDSFS